VSGKLFADSNALFSEQFGSLAALFNEHSRLQAFFEHADTQYLSDVTTQLECGGDLNRLFVQTYTLIVNVESALSVAFWCVFSLRNNKQYICYPVALDKQAMNLLGPIAIYWLFNDLCISRQHIY
jgi:hypothetical protein